MKFIINTLLHNDYPIDFIFNTINSRLKILFHKLRMKGNNVDSDTTNEKHPSWFVLPCCFIDVREIFYYYEEYYREIILLQFE